MRPGIEHRSPEPLVKTLPIRPMSRLSSVNWNIQDGEILSVYFLYHDKEKCYKKKKKKKKIIMKLIKI